MRTVVMGIATAVGVLLAGFAQAENCREKVTTEIKKRYGDMVAEGLTAGDAVALAKPTTLRTDINTAGRSSQRFITELPAGTMLTVAERITVSSYVWYRVTSSGQDGPLFILASSMPWVDADPQAKAIVEARRQTLRTELEAGCR